MPLSSSFLSLHFADDTTLLLSRHMITSKPLSRCVNFFVLTNLFSTWIKQNLFYSPVQNEQFQTEHSWPDPPYCQRSSHWLGVFFDPDLNFKHHSSILKIKLSKALYALRTVRNSLGVNSLLFLYYSIFHCHLIYAGTIWSRSRSGPISDLFKKQQAAVRLISGSSYNSHIEPLFKKYKLLHFRT